MNKAQKINAAMAIINAVIICCVVYYQWSKQGCGAWSLFAGCAYYCTITAALWSVINSKLKGK